MFHAMVGAGLLPLLGCAGQIVRPSDIASPTLRTPADVRGVVLLLEAAPPAMADEARRLGAQWADSREGRLSQGDGLASLCSAPGGVVMRLAQGRTYFASNAGDRNALIIYESAIVVGLPVAAISALAWPWYGETIIEGTLDTVRCGRNTEPTRLVASAHVRSEGRGLVRGGTIQKAQEEAALRLVTRKLFALAADDAR